MAENKVESVAEEIANVEEVNNNVIDSVDDTRHTLNDEHRKIVERLNEIMLEGKTSDGIMFNEEIFEQLMKKLSILKAKTSQKQMISLKLQVCG